MQLADDLLAQAELLISADSNKPKQANLRRAVSSAYYAIFHEVCDRVVRYSCGTGDATGGIGGRVRRVISHTSVATAARWFATDKVTRPEAIEEIRLPPGGHVDPIQFKSACAIIVELQAARHSADYDLSVALQKAEAARLVRVARNGVNYLRSCKDEQDVKIFVFGCLLGNTFTKNS